MCSRPSVLAVFTLLLPAIMLISQGIAGDGMNPRPHPFADQKYLSAISYGPHRDGQRPGGNAPTVAEIREDLHLMEKHWHLLRVYGSSGFAETLLKVIEEEGSGMKVMLGVWIAPHSPETNAVEIDAAVRLAGDYPDIVLAVSVGNETQVHWSAHRSSLDLLMRYVGDVRARTTVPVTVADDFNFWNKPESKVLSGTIDFITLHAHPMWNGVLVDDALAWLNDQTLVVQDMHPDRLVVIGETGWATSVHTEGEQAELIKGKPGQLPQKKFYDAVQSWSQTRQITVFFFEAFDEKWKGGNHSAEVEKHWGLYRADRSPKVAVAGQ